MSPEGKNSFHQVLNKIYPSGESYHDSLHKRLLDITGASLGLTLVGIPVGIAAALAIYLEDGLPIFFSFEALGKGGKPFPVYKLRSKTIGNSIPVAGRAVDYMKNYDDPKITNVGRIIRQWSIDEVPQFLNVLKGDMSLVGTRPKHQGIFDAYVQEPMFSEISESWKQICLSTKPGITGITQINGRGDLYQDHEGIKLSMQYDMDTVTQAHLLRDIMMIAKTFVPVLMRKGAV